MSKKIVVLIIDEFEDLEFILLVVEFCQVGYEVIIIEKEVGKMVKGKKGEVSVIIDKVIDDVCFDEFDVLLLLGGYLLDYLCGDSCFVDFICDFVNSGKLVFVICYGLQLLISVDVICGCKFMVVKLIIIDVKNVGVEFYDQEVVVDKDQLVISCMFDDLLVFNCEVLCLLGV